MMNRFLLAVFILLLAAEPVLAAQSGAMRPGITRRVTTGTTDTAGFTDLGGQISWQSATAAAKTQTLMACNNLIDGLRIGVVDGQYTAATYPITVVAASGNVGGTSAGLPITGNGMGVIFVCDGATTNWAVAGLMPSAGAITWPNVPNAESTCTITGVGSPKVFTPTCANNYITIDAAGETINVPSNMPANPLPPPGTPSATNASAGYALFLTYTGAFTPTFGAGTQWQSGTAPVACSGSATGCLSSANGLNDFIQGKSLSATKILYGVPITNYKAPLAWTFVNAGSCISSGGAVCTTAQVNMTANGGADLIVYAYSWYNGGGATFTNATDSSSNTYTNVITQIGGNQTLKCGYVQAPTVTSTMTFSAAVTGTPFNAMSVAGFKGSVASPLDKSNSTGAASGTTLNTGATGTPVQDGELMAACLGLSASNTGTTSGTSIDSSYTLVGATNAASGSNNGTAIGYLFQGTAASSNPAFGWTASAGTSGASAGIMTFK